MAKLILFNKPFQVLCQFSRPEGSHKATLADHLDIPDVYAAGRLDYDSEGLLLLTDNGQLQHQIAHPDYKAPKTYWVQVEGIPNEEVLDRLRKGIELKDGLTRPAQVEIINEPNLWERHPPIRQRANIPTTWLSITITEGRNRQVRRMTAAIEHPTLRLIRSKIGDWSIADLAPGDYMALDVDAPPPKTHKKKQSYSKGKSTHRFNEKHKSGKIARRKPRQAGKS